MGPRAGAARRAPAPVRQVAGPARAQDGPPHDHRARRATSAACRARSGGHLGHRALLASKEAHDVILDGAAPASIAQAAALLARGELVAFPTETVYGLGADATADAAVAKIFAAKGRPGDHPLIVHVPDAAGAQAFAAAVPPFARRLMDAFWPGPLTLILPRRAGLPSAAPGTPAT